MVSIHESYIVNENGEKTAVIIKIDDYNKIKEILKYFDEFDCLDINTNIAKGLKDIEEGRVYDIEKLLDN